MKLYTVKEVAETLKLSEETIRRYLRDNKLSGIKVNGGSWLIKQEQLDQFLKGGE